MYIIKAILYCTVLIALVNGYVWRKYDGTIPEDAVLGHFGRYIGQVDVGAEGLLPVTIYPNQREAVGELHGKKVYKNNIKILCKNPEENIYWEYVDASKIDPNTFSASKLLPGGHERTVTLYIGRMFHESEWKVSKVFPPGNPSPGLYLWPQKNGAAQKFQYIEMLHIDRN